MEVSIDKEIIISAIAANYNISEIAVDLSKYSNRQILESLEYYLRYRDGRLLWNRKFNGRKGESKISKEKRLEEK